MQCLSNRKSKLHLDSRDDTCLYGGILSTGVCCYAIMKPYIVNRKRNVAILIIS